MRPSLNNNVTNNNSYLHFVAEFYCTLHCDYFMCYAGIRKGFVKFSKPLTPWLHRMISDRAKTKQIFFPPKTKGFGKTNKQTAKAKKKNKTKQNDNHNFRIILELRKGCSVFWGLSISTLFSLCFRQKSILRESLTIYSRRGKEVTVSYRKRHKYPLMERCW